MAIEEAQVTETRSAFGRRKQKAFQQAKVFRPRPSNAQWVPITEAETLTAILIALRDLHRLIESDPRRLAVGGHIMDFRATRHWPVPNGIRDILSDQRQHGHDNLVVPAGTSVATLVCSPNPGRLGGSIVNSGNNPVFFYLADPRLVTYQAGGTASGQLTPSGSWDFRGFTEGPWCGFVSAISPLGTTLTWGES